MVTNLEKILLKLLFIILFSTTLSADFTNKKNILVLHSYHPGMTWIENINKAVNDTLKPKTNDYVIYTEYMDTKRHSSSEYYKGLEELYKKKYKDIKFDIILSSDNNAFNFLIKKRDEIFGDVPVSFCGVNGFEKDMLKSVKNFTGAIEQFSDKETVDTILKLHPEAKNLYIINDYLPTGLAWKKDMRKNLKDYKDKINIIYSQNITLDELRDKINSFKNDTVILLGVYFADKNKKYVTYEKIGSYLLENSKAPVYCLLNFNISNNIIGGKVISGYSQGEAMSKIAIRILDGFDPHKISITSSEANDYVFNYNGIKKYDIDDGLLPKGSKIINKPFSLYEEYKSLLYSFIVISISILIMFILFLTYLKIKNKKDESSTDKVIISFIRFSPIFIIPVVTAIVVLLFIYSTNQNHKYIEEIEKEAYIENAKQISKREVDRFIDIARSRIALADINDTDELGNVKENTLRIAQNIKYGKSGYLIVVSSDGYMLSHTNKNLIGAYFFDPKHDKMKNIFLKLKNRVEKSGKGFIEYKWVNPSSKIEEKKITYVNLLPELNWYVASGVYMDEIDKYIEEKIKNNSIFDEKNIQFIILSSVFLLVLSLIISIVISIIIKNIFKRYRNSIYKEIERSKEIEKSKQLFKVMANTDALTQIHNRLSIMSIFKDEYLKVKQLKTPLSVIMFDIDYFKNINDTYGHDAGDRVLISMSKIIKEDLRDHDCLGRYGGEEFLIVLPNTNLNISKVIAERLRKRIEDHQFENIKNITISLGVVEVKEDESENEVLKRVDNLLYNSKRTGRNKVSF